MASEAGTRRVAINIDTYVCLYALYVIFSVIHVDEEEEANGGRLERLAVDAEVIFSRRRDGRFGAVMRTTDVARYHLSYCLYWVGVDVLDIRGSRILGV